MEIFDTILSDSIPPGWLAIGAGASGLLLLACIRILCKRPKNVLAYETDNGRVMVSLHAITELVETSCEQLRDVYKIRVFIDITAGTIHFQVRIKLLSGACLRSIEETLQNHLRKTLRENLGIENLGRIDIIATGIKSGRIDSSLPAKSGVGDTSDGASVESSEESEADKTV